MTRRAASSPRGYLRCVFHATGKGVVGAFAVARVVIGVAFAFAPSRVSGGPASADDAILMTRSFAVREVALGVGGLLALAQADRRPSDVRLWAALGAFTDGGDLCAALASTRSEASSARVPALVATAGLLCELWAFRALTPTRAPRI
jgi:peptidoglycan/LPS O-acetylase OafA/YrhL